MFPTTAYDLGFRCPPPLIMMFALISDVECLVKAPEGLKVIVRGSTATLYWMSDQDGLIGFELTYEVLDSPYGTFRLTHGVNRLKRSCTLRALFPLHKYSVYMVTIAENGVSNKSESVEFSTNLTGAYTLMSRGM